MVIAGFRLLPAVYDALVGPLMRRTGLSRTETPAGTGNVFGPEPRLAGGPGRFGRTPIAAAVAVTALALAAAASRINRAVS